MMNQKLSTRQVMRLYVFDLMGIGTLLLPPYLAKLCGLSGVYAIILGTGLGFLYLAYLGPYIQYIFYIEKGYHIGVSKNSIILVYSL